MGSTDILEMKHCPVAEKVVLRAFIDSVEEGGFWVFFSVFKVWVYPLTHPLLFETWSHYVTLGSLLRLKRPSIFPFLIRLKYC